MSMDIAESRAKSSRLHPKDRDKSDKGGERKRKHKSAEAIESSPTKKHKHRKHKDSHSHQSQQIPPEAADKSPFQSQTSSLYLPLSPIAQSHPLQGLCAEHVSPLILNYYAPFNGVVLSFSNARLSNDGDNSSVTDGRQKVFARSYNEYAANFVWLTADFLIFRPEHGSILEGFINLQNETNIGLVCYNFFSASIERKRLPKDWKWVPGGMSIGKRKKKLKKPADDEMEVDDEAQGTVDLTVDFGDVEGHFEDARGSRIGGVIQFKVHSVDAPRTANWEYSILSIQGTLLSEQDEEHLVREEQGESVPGTSMIRGGGAKDGNSDPDTLQNHTNH